MLAMFLTHWFQFNYWMPHEVFYKAADWPNVFVDIAPTLEAKVRAMQFYESETRAFPHPRSPEALRANAQRWGSVVGCTAAEAFELVRAVV